jgi:aminopeptidase-like protein
MQKELPVQQYKLTEVYKNLSFKFSLIMNISNNNIEEVNNYFTRLFPITRSLTGNGNRETLKILQEIISLNIYEYPTGKKVFDWEIPKEWNIKDAWIKNSKGEKIIDFANNNLHLMSYSTPINGKFSFDELKKHLFFSENFPDLIPYKTSYYNENWGFCLSYNEYNKIFNENEEYNVFIDSNLSNGSLTLADISIGNNEGKEFIFSTYFCHPSMANDNLSGVILSALLARELKKKEHELKNKYRFVFAPETIGIITYCSENIDAIKKLSGGYILTCVAGKGSYGYKQTFLEEHEVDKAVLQTFQEMDISFILYPFEPQGSDERQYSSPGFRIPVGSIHKDKYHEYDYYHNSGDNLDFVDYEAVLKTMDIYLEVINKLENNVRYKTNNPFCEPQLGKRGLYPKIGRGIDDILQKRNAKQIYNTNQMDIMMWLLFYGNGELSLLEICSKHFLNFDKALEILKALEKEQLVKID